MKSKAAAGFTLLELATVLVILGIILGGVMLGRSLLTSSHLQSVIADVDNITSAVSNFKQAYQSLPGDDPNATANWGTASNGCPDGGGTGTCNGNGDGEIGTVTGYEYESYRFWQHLYDAGVLQYNLKGFSVGGTYGSVLNFNVPAGSVPGSGFFVWWIGMRSSGGGSNLFPGFYGNAIQFGSTRSGVDVVNYPILTPDQAGAVDTKMDDGLPATGKVRTYISSASYGLNCTTSDDPSTAVYNVTYTSVACPLIFVMGF
jgi:prepilin-type N-terminal cleavage/methylation domain-containing protein